MKIQKGKRLANKFVKKCFTERQRRISRPRLLRDTLRQVSVDGLFLEFGVWQGLSINELAAMRPEKKFYGFDCFTGLPEDWSESYPKGWMKVDGLPPVKENVELVIGLFQDTLEPFLSTHKEKVAYLHLDADLYSSTKYVLFTLADHNRLHRGTIIEFDEIFYQDSPNTLLDDEHRVFNEFIEKYDVKIRWLYFYQKNSTIRASLIIDHFGGKREKTPLSLIQRIILRLRNSDYLEQLNKWIHSTYVCIRCGRTFHLMSFGNGSIICPECWRAKHG